MKPKKIPYSGNPADYHYVNALVAFIILLMLFAAKYRWVAVHCVYAQNGGSCKTCGLTTAFYNLLNGGYGTIPKSFLALFTLFAGQLLVRPGVSLLLVKTKRFRLIRNLDVAISIIVFVVFLVLLYH